MFPLPIISNTYKISEYDKFVLEIQSLPTRLNSSVMNPVSKVANTTTTPKRFKSEPYITPLAGETLTGTPFNFIFRGNTSRFIQHCFPTQQIYNDYIANNLLCAFTISSNITGVSVMTNADRNGYLSLTSSSTGAANMVCTEFTYYDSVLEKVMTYNPSVPDSVPVHYYGNSVYEKFLQDIRYAPSLTVLDAIDFYPTSTTNPRSGYIRTELSAYTNTYASNIMKGTPYQNFFARSESNTTLGRVVQHCFPTQELYQNHIQKGYSVYMKLMVNVASASLSAVSRNGYTSTAGSDYSASVVDFIYYDESTNQIMRYNPYVVGSVPVEYYSSLSEHDRFMSEIRAYSSNNIVSNGSIISIGLADNNLKIMHGLNLHTGSMYGSVYKRKMADASYNRLVQHALPDLSTYQSYLDNGYVCAFRAYKFENTSPFLAYDRNGYLSVNPFSTRDSYEVYDFIYYDKVTGYMMKYNPTAINSEPQRLYKPEQDYTEYDRFVKEEGLDSFGSIPVSVPIAVTNNYPITDSVQERCFVAESEFTNIFMYGSPYGNIIGYSGSSKIGRIIQHCYPTQDLYLDNTRAGRACKYKLEFFTRDTSTSIPSISRNGYTSLGVPSGSGPEAAICTNFIYFDSTTGYMMQYNPYLMTTPTRYYS